MTCLLVTGGAGFIGSALIRQLIKETDVTIVNVDALTYAGNLESLGDACRHPRHTFEHTDICQRPELDRILHERRPDAIVHLAAETHVDRSIEAPAPFVETNVAGTHHVLEAARAYWLGLEPHARDAFRFLLVSTDEVYGELGDGDAAFTEDSRYAPSSPYAASKAAADHLAHAWRRTYGLPVLIAHCCNNYGPYQFPEKLIPLVILNALERKPLPLYGDGHNVRDWLHVEDNARALRLVLEAGKPGHTYNISAGEERSNLEIVETVCAILDELEPCAAGPHAELIRFVADRPGHDRRYSMDGARMRDELGWRASRDLETGIASTVRWYLHHEDWVRRVRAGEHRQLTADHGGGGAAG